MTKGKTAIITGSTSGIGLGIAEALAGAGMNIMLNGFGEAAEIVNYRIQGEYYVVDKLFSAAELRLGEDDQQIVRIERKRGLLAGLGL